MEHTLPGGQQAIAAVVALGRALGYVTRTEHPVGRRAAVDVSWSGDADAKAPLFVFEVESTASAGMANNALKVLGSPNEIFAKPLFFFHLVLTGSADNERVAALRSQWGRHNYRVYTMADGWAARLLLWDVLEQHRRVSSRVDPLAVADALGSALWEGIDASEALAEAERLGLRGNYLRAYLILSGDDDRWLGSWGRRLRALAAMPEPVWRKQGDDYDSFGGRYIPGLIEHALLVRAGQILDADGPAALDRWQAGEEFGLRTIGPHFGLSRDYDFFVLLVAPLHFAVAWALCSAAPTTSRWLVDELAGLLAGMASEGVQARWRVPAALWLAHVASAALHRPSGDEAKVPASAAYDAAAACLAEAGGVSAAELLAPPMPKFDLDEWMGPTGGLKPPDPAGLRALVDGVAGTAADRPAALGLAVAMLTSEEWALIPPETFVAAVHFGGPRV